MSKEKMNYEAAITELEQIVNEIEEGDISVDDLSTKIKRSSVLIKFCKQKLKSTEEDVDEILREMNQAEA
ncbi:MAG: exodeoxyribonuclease VII small subunit [Bacteroidetes bacterium]|nr:MAG: exodeoxyribonuclease VII small subunit [Bacteroidota bacterium]